MRMSMACLNGDCLGCPDKDRNRAVCQCTHHVELPLKTKEALGISTTPKEIMIDSEVVKLARYMLSAEQREANGDPTVGNEIISLCDALDNAADGWFERQKRLKAARRAFRGSKGLPLVDKKLANK